MAISHTPWGNVSASDYSDAGAYCKASLVDLNAPGASKTKSACHLPVYEPGGALNANGVHAAAAALAGARGGVNIPQTAKAAAARKLIRLYGELNEEPPPSLRRIAGM